jgi:hypothetical protein
VGNIVDAFRLRGCPGPIREGVDRNDPNFIDTFVYT